MFPLSSFRLGSDREIGFLPGIILVNPSDATVHRPSTSRPPWSTCPPPTAASVGGKGYGDWINTGELSTIFAARFRTVREDGADLPTVKRSVRGIHYFLDKITLGVDHIPVLERVTLVGVDPDGMVHLLHSLFYVPACEITRTKYKEK